MDNHSGMVLSHEKRKNTLKNSISNDEHTRALQSGIDIPEQIPSFEFPLTAVGITNKTVWIHLPQGRLPFTVGLQVDLPSESRGIHMSRMEEAISDLLEIQFACINDYVRELGRRVVLKQRGQRGVIRLSGKLPLTRTTAISDRQSIDSIEIETTASFYKQNNTVSESIMSGVGVYHITACPCTQAYNSVLFPDRLCPQITHSQRSFTKLIMEIHNEFPATKDLLACLESSLHVTQDLLKRPDEAEIVMKAHSAPQFAEDAVRETAGEAGRRFGHKLPGSSRITIDSLSMESIHIHNVSCRLETTLGEIVTILKKDSKKR
jgi:GTP cyclohydrolase FolE2